jgi:hypothetical protein
MFEHRIEQAVAGFGEPETIVGPRRFILGQIDRHAPDTERRAAIGLDANRSQRGQSERK